MILSIDTATEQATICLSKDGAVINTLVNDNQKDHAAWVQAAIYTLLQKSGYAMQQLEAVAVTQGPGQGFTLRDTLGDADTRLERI